MIYNGTSDGDPTQDIFAVTNETKEILGIPTRVIHDDGYVKDKHEETTNDWFAPGRSRKCLVYGRIYNRS